MAKDIVYFTRRLSLIDYNSFLTLSINFEAASRNARPGELMTRKSIFRRVLIGFLAAALLALPAFAATIRLKDGSLIKGTIVSFTGGRFVIVIGEGTRRREFTIAVDEVASIEFEKIEETSASVVKTSQPNEPRIVPTSSRTTPVLTEPENTRQTAPSQKPASPVLTSDDVDKPPVMAPITAEKQNPTPATPAAASSSPISFEVRVLADNTANGWTNSGFVVKKGQRIRITGSGTVSLGKGQSSTPAGLADLDDPEKLLKGVPTGALIAVIGDDNNDFIYIGTTREFTAGRDGTLYLGVNEGNLNDNSGSFNIRIEIDPATAECGS